MSTEETREQSGIEILEHNSSTILKSKYIAAEEELFIECIGGTTYCYAQVTQNQYDGFKEAESKGKYLNSEIKGTNSYTKLEA